MDKGLKKLYLGDFNTMNQEIQPDGSIVIILSSEKYPEQYRFRVKDLYGESEEVLEHEVIKSEAENWFKKRMDEAKK